MKITRMIRVYTIIGSDEIYQIDSHGEVRI